MKGWFRQARGSHESLKRFILCVITANTMTNGLAKPTKELTWEALRKKSSMLGVPAWKLAEDFAVHGNEGKVEVRENPQV